MQKHMWITIIIFFPKSRLSRAGPLVFFHFQWFNSFTQFSFAVIFVENFGKCFRWWNIVRIHLMRPIFLAVYFWCDREEKKIKSQKEFYLWGDKFNKIIMNMWTVNIEHTHRTIVETMKRIKWLTLALSPFKCCLFLLLSLGSAMANERGLSSQNKATVLHPIWSDVRDKPT